MARLTTCHVMEYRRGMQVTIDLPRSLRELVSAQSEGLAAFLARALRSKERKTSVVRREVISFFARGPHPSEIIAFRPSEASAQRMFELLERNREGTLSSAEEAEMDEIEEIDTLVSLLKAEARKYLRETA